MTLRPKAPPIEGVWLNCDPIAPRDLLNRVTVVLFWAASCEASLVRLHELERLRERLGARIAVIAVHSPRLQSDLDQQFVADLVHRHQLSIPVIHDEKLETLGHYGFAGRPATVVIDHRNRVVGAVEGLDDLELIDAAVELADGIAISARGRSGQAPRPLPRLSSAPPLRLDQLNWPSAVCMLTDDLLAVVDEGNSRLLIAAIAEHRRSARVVNTFDALVGLGSVCALEDRQLAISFPDSGRVEALDIDTGNRRVLLDGLVRPRGLVRDADGSVVVADAGANQLIRLCSDGSWGAVAGSGFTGVRDGDAGMAELAQPVAVERVPRGLLFIDSGSNSVRMLTDKGSVLTITAHDRGADRILDPGLVDGPAHAARFERPLDIVKLPDDRVIVIDTGNNRLRVLDERKIRTVPLAGLRRPEAAAACGPSSIIVADTGNHRLVMVDLAAGSSSTLTLTGLTERKQATKSARAPDALNAVVGGAVVLGFPTPGPGPWTISVTTNPSWLLTRPITVHRTRGDEPVVAHLGGAGDGELVVRVSTPEDRVSEIVRRSISVLPH